jgi:type I pantothenate kinase
VTSPEIAFEVFTREQWASLGRGDQNPVSQEEMQRLVASGEPVTRAEVVDVYLPLARLLALDMATRREAHQSISTFLGQDPGSVPYIIGIAGSVAVGKSTTARVLQALLREGAGHPEVELLTTDGFLYPNATLAERGIMERKGFPESYDQHSLLGALAALRAGVPEVVTPVYSHLSYDIVPDEYHTLRRPDIVIVEGLNVLQVNTRGASPAHVVVSDFFDFSMYVDAAEEVIERWFTQRLLALRTSVLKDPDSYFHQLVLLPEDEVARFAQQIWNDINVVNLRENVAPTRGRANLVLQKDSQHSVYQVLLRRT